MRYLVFVVFLSVGYFTGYSQGEERTKPNIIFVLADDLGWADLPMYGNEYNEAPHLAQLAREGMMFTNAYAASPVCSPTRASLQTGQYPARLGINDFLPGHWRPYEQLTVPSNVTQYLPLSYTTVGESLQQVGYRTGYFGKWHLGHTEKHYPKNQGYDESRVFQGGKYFDFNDLMHPETDFPPEKPLSEALTDLSIQFIEDSSDQPFFLFLAHYDVHVQLNAQDSLIRRFRDKPKAEGYPSNAVYAAMIANLDRSIGRLVAKLDERGITENTLLVFFSDNGGLVSRFDEVPLIADSQLHWYQDDSIRFVATSNRPLHGEKGTVYEGGIRVPMIVRWPGTIAAGEKSAALVSSIDFLPTFVDFAEGALPAGQVTDGVSLRPVLEGRPADERPLFWHYPVYHHGTPASAVRMGGWKLIHTFADNRLQLYHLSDDLAEQDDLSEKYPEKKAELYELLTRWYEEVDAARPVRNENFNVAKREVWGTHPARKEMLNRK